MTEEEANKIAEELTDYLLWVAKGLRNGWIGEPWCYVHGTPDLTEEELQMTDHGEDLDAVCIMVTRIGGSE